MTLRRRIAVAAAALAVAAAGAGGVATYNAHTSADEAQRQEDVLLPSSADVRELLSSFVDQETGERGYVLTQQGQFLQPFLSGRAAAQQLIGDLREMFAAQPEVTAAIGQVDAAYQRWLVGTAEAEIALVRRGQQPAAVAQEKTGSGKAQFDALRSAEGRLQGLVDGEVRTESHRIATGDHRTLYLVAAITVLALLAFAGVALLARRWILRPIDRVASAARQVARGDLDLPVAASGPPELRALADDVESMRRRLRDELAEAERVREALEQQAPLLSSVRRELEPSMAIGDLPVGVAARLLPATGVLAGDWYDVFSPKPGVVTAAVVDISGHGPDAGLFAYQLKNLLTAAMRVYDDPGACLGWVADQLGDTGDRFATAVVLRFDVREATCQWANAGHPAALRVRGDACLDLPATGPLLGPLPGTWLSGTVDVELGTDTFVAYTDGISEAHRPGGELFGDQRLRQAVLAAVGGEPEAVVESVLGAVAAHEGQRLRDDATVVVVQPGR